MTRRLARGILTLGLAVLFAGGARAQSPDAEPAAAAPRMVAAQFHSNWCAVCQLLAPKVAAVKPDFADSGVEYVKFDFTWGKKKKHEGMAAEFGVRNVYERFKRGQGYIIFVDANSGEITDIVTGLQSREELRRAFARAAAREAMFPAQERRAAAQIGLD